MTLRILLVDDHALFRSGIRLLLQQEAEFEIVGEASDGLDGVKRAQQLSPDVVLLDLNMPGLSGLEALQLIKQDRPQCTVLILTVSEEGDELAQALRSGANGYLLKNMDADALVRSIHKATTGTPVIAENMTAKLVAQLQKPMKHNGQNVEIERLTPREREILQSLARGESNKEIARNLNLAESTVKIHVQNILKKLHLSSRVQAAVYAVGQGLPVR